MIDIHCHILPGIDDGAKDMNDSLALAKAAVQQGIRTIVATPHHKNGRYENSRLSILQKVSELNAFLQQEEIPLTILPGQELRINGEILEDLAKEEILPVNDGGKYVLIELPSGQVPRFTEQLLFELQLKGVTPIIAHPERNQEIIENPDLLYNLVEKGALTQITAASIVGYFGKKISRFSYQLIDANLTHFVASDAHNLNNRTFKVMEAYDSIEKKYGVDAVYMFKENAELLVKGNHVYKEPPSKVKQKRFFGIF